MQNFSKSLFATAFNLNTLGIKLSTEGASPLSHNHYKVELLPRTIVRALEMAGDVR